MNTTKQPESLIWISEENKNTLEISYHLILTYDRNQKEEKVYSILLVLKDSYFKIETAFAYDVSRNYEEAWQLIQKLHKGKVTPTTLFDILEDSIGI